MHVRRSCLEKRRGSSFVFLHGDGLDRTLHGSGSESSRLQFPALSERNFTTSLLSRTSPNSVEVPRLFYLRQRFQFTPLLTKTVHTILSEKKVIPEDKTERVSGVIGRRLRTALLGLGIGISCGLLLHCVEFHHVLRSTASQTQKEYRR